MRSPITVNLRTAVPRKTSEREKKSDAHMKARTDECGTAKGARERLSAP